MQNVLAIPYAITTGRNAGKKIEIVPSKADIAWSRDATSLSNLLRDLSVMSFANCKIDYSLCLISREPVFLRRPTVFFIPHS
jgi:hypothetical protein